MEVSDGEHLSVDNNKSSITDREEIEIWILKDFLRNAKVKGNDKSLKRFLLQHESADIYFNKLRLENLDFSKVDLSWIDFSNSTFHNCNFEDAYIFGTVLQNVTFINCTNLTVFQLATCDYEIIYSEAELSSLIEKSKLLKTKLRNLNSIDVSKSALKDKAMEEAFAEDSELRAFLEYSADYLESEAKIQGLEKPAYKKVIDLKSSSGNKKVIHNPYLQPIDLSLSRTLEHAYYFEISRITNAMLEEATRATKKRANTVKTKDKSEAVEYSVVSRRSPDSEVITSSFRSGNADDKEAIITGHVNQFVQGELVMKLGEGFDVLTHHFKEKAILLEHKALFSSDDISSLTESELKSKVLQYPYSPGSYRLKCFESLEELKEIVNASLGLGLKLSQLGLSMDVLAGRANRVDANCIYYLLELKCGEYTHQLASLPEFNEYAKKTLGILPPELVTLQLEIDQKEAELNKKQLDLRTTYQELSVAEKNSKLARDNYELALAEFQAIEESYLGRKEDDKSKRLPGIQELESKIAISDESKKLLTESNIKVATTQIIVQKTRKALEILQSTIDKYMEDINTKKSELAKHTSALNQLKQDLVAGISEIGIVKFNKRFGTHFVNKVSYGRQFIALITIDRESVMNKKSLRTVLERNKEHIAIDDALDKEMAELAKRIIVKIDVVWDGFQLSALSAPKNMLELQEAIKRFSNRDFYAALPVVIDFEIASYRDVFSSVCMSDQINYMYNRISSVQNIHDQLISLRTIALRCYASRYFHHQMTGIQSNSFISDSQYDLKNDPHTRSLYYIYDYLSELIDYFNKVIHVLVNEPYNKITGIIAAAEARVLQENLEYHAHAPNIVIDLLRKRLFFIKEKLELLAGFRLIHIISYNITGVLRAFPRTMFTLKIPFKASKILISVTNNPPAGLIGDGNDDPKFPNIVRHEDINVMPQPFNIQGIPNPGIEPQIPENNNNAAAVVNSVLGWPNQQDEFKISFFQHSKKSPKIGVKKVMTATKTERLFEVTDDIRNCGELFSVSQKLAISAQSLANSPANGYCATIRFFAAVTDGRLNLGNVDQDSLNIVTQALEKITYTELADHRGTESVSGKCVVQ